MGDRLRAAAEEAAADPAPAAPIIRPAAPGNREMADKLGAGPVGKDDVAGLSGSAGNRAVANWLGSSGSTPSAAPATPQMLGAGTSGVTQAGPAGPVHPGPVPAVPEKVPAAGPQAQATTSPPKAVVAPPPTDWIEALPGHIKQQIDNFQPEQTKAADAGDKKWLDVRARNRVTFMETMRWAMGNDDAVIQKHFQEIAPIDVGSGGELWAHISTRERLLEVKAELETQGVPMPQTTVGLGMRGDHLARADKGRGWFTHAVGFAVDWRAYQTPKIADQKLITLFEMVTGGRPDMKTSVESDKRIDLEIKMGQGTADAAESKKLLDSVESEYKRLTEASAKFKTDLLPAEAMDRLRALEKARVAVQSAQRKLTTLKKRRAPQAQIAAAETALAAAREPYEKLKAAITADLPKIFEPWVKKIDDKIAVIDQHFADANVDVGLLTSDYGFKERGETVARLKRANVVAAGKAGPDEGRLRQLHQDALALQARIEAVKAGGLSDPDLDRAAEATEAVLHGMEPLEDAIGELLPKAKFEMKPAKAGSGKDTAAALKVAADKLGPRFLDLAKRIVPAAATYDQNAADIPATQEDIANRRKYRDEKTAALGKKKVDALIDEKFDLLNLKALKDGLLTNAGGFVFRDGIDVNDPALDQLMGLMPENKGGFFTPDEEGGEKEAKAGTFSGSHGYGLTFISTMVAHGFEAGMAWRGGSDPMHFELAEGRKFLTSAGASPVVAGADLRAEEEKKAEGRR
ncbi:hypothetical protein [Actinoplanes sp. NPDC026619]|uniref:hypothetical protein n=1 Tax=Actinoplanes sp. NPDC026619 TaxID=3155798 RepID=UPI0033CDC9AF